MKITVSNFIKQISEDNYQKKLLVIDENDFKKQGIVKIATLMTEPLISDIEKNQLTQIQLHLTCSDYEVDFLLETAIINLPYSNINRVDNFFEVLDEPLELNVNLIVKSEYINVSHFRIDFLSTTENLLRNKKQFISNLTVKLLEKIAIIEKNAKNQTN